MGDEEDKETIFQEAARTAWVRVFIREASKRGFPIENIVALLDEPGLTVEEPRSGFCLPEGQTQTRPEEYMKIARNSERGGNSPSIRAALKINQRPVFTEVLLSHAVCPLSCAQSISKPIVRSQQSEPLAPSSSVAGVRLRGL